MTARTVILVRHGKAQSRDLGLPDVERTLTKAGTQALRAWLPKSAKLARELLAEGRAEVRSGARVGLDEGAVPAEVWVSPTERTRQTAAEVVRAYAKDGMHDVPVIEHECLLRQDFAAFCAELAETSAPCVIAVGHNPFIEDALACLCGVRIECATGAVAAVRLPQNAGDWFASEIVPADGTLAEEEIGYFDVVPDGEGSGAAGVEASARDGASAGDGAEASAATPAAPCETASAATSCEATPAVEREATPAATPAAASAATPAAALPRVVPGIRSEQPRLLWFVQGPRSQRWKVRNAVQDAVRAWDETVEARLGVFLANPDEPETLHKLRVSIRTLRSLLAFASPFLDRKRHKALQRDLRAVVIGTSRLREYDVLMKQAAGLSIPTSELVEAVRSARDAERDDVVAFLGGPEVKAALKRVRKGVKRLPWTRDAERWGIAPEDARARFDEMVRGVDEGFETVDFADADAVHTLRKNAKRVRYAAENFGGVLGADMADEARRMVGVQDRLGDVCDARVNVGIVCEFPTEGLSPEARRALGALLERNMAFEEAFLREVAR